MRRKREDKVERSIGCEDRVLDLRIDLAFPAPAAEYAVMSHTRLMMMALHMRAQSRTKIVGCRRLAD